MINEIVKHEQTYTTGTYLPVVHITFNNTRIITFFKKHVTHIDSK